MINILEALQIGKQLDNSAEVKRKAILTNLVAGVIPMVILFKPSWADILTEHNVNVVMSFIGSGYAFFNVVVHAATSKKAGF